MSVNVDTASHVGRSNDQSLSGQTSLRFSWLSAIRKALPRQDATTTTIDDAHARAHEDPPCAAPRYRWQRHAAAGELRCFDIETVSAEEGVAGEVFKEGADVGRLGDSDGFDELSPRSKFAALYPSIAPLYERGRPLTKTAFVAQARRHEQLGSKRWWHTRPLKGSDLWDFMRLNVPSLADVYGEMVGITTDVGAMKDDIYERIEKDHHLPLRLVSDIPQLANILLRAERPHNTAHHHNETLIFATSVAHSLPTITTTLHQLFTTLLPAGKINDAIRMAKALRDDDYPPAVNAIDDFPVIHDAYHISKTVWCGDDVSGKVVWRTRLGRVLAQLKCDLLVSGLSRTVLEELTWAYLVLPRTRWESLKAEGSDQELTLHMWRSDAHEAQSVESAMTALRERYRVVVLVDLTHPVVRDHVVWDISEEGKLVARWNFSPNERSLPLDACHVVDHVGFTFDADATVCREPL